jgi:hypothetical protein
VNAPARQPLRFLCYLLFKKISQEQTKITEDLPAIHCTSTTEEPEICSESPARQLLCYLL